jgi:hypothetical protein
MQILKIAVEESSKIIIVSKTYCIWGKNEKSSFYCGDFTSN